MSTYIQDGAEIYRQSFATIRAETPGLEALDPVLERTVVRMIHACGMTDLVGDVAASPGFGAAGEAALQAGAAVLCDTNMVASGVTRRRLPADNPVLCTLTDPRVADHAAAIGNTRTAAAVELWADHLAGALVVIGNAPTALFHLLDLLEAGRLPRPAAIVGAPVGFIGAAESKEDLALRAPALGVEHVIVRGRRGGSAIAAAAVNALASAVE